MVFRKTLSKDIPEIMIIIKQAQNFLKESGVDQWQNGYPDEFVVKNDIENGYSYVLEKYGKIVATIAITFENEESYKKIYEGKWLMNDKYATIHRIAVNNKYKGMGFSAEILKEAEKLCIELKIPSIKIDTHEDNLVMQKILKKNGFTYCGVIYLKEEFSEKGAKRLAFERILKK